MKKLLMFTLLAIGSLQANEAEEQEFNDIQEVPGTLFHLEAKAMFSQRYETTVIVMSKLNATSLHGAVYADGTCIITAVAGPGNGLQEIYFNDVLQASSVDIRHTKDGFIHNYPNGRVTSFSNRQIAELY